jgi:hypothetical protein
MLNFIDTNVLIGYCFEADQWHDQCRIVDSTDNLCLSKRVLDEWNDLEDELLDKRTSLINRHIEYVKRKFPDMIEVTNRERLIETLPSEIESFVGRIYHEQLIDSTPTEVFCEKIELRMLEVGKEKVVRFQQLESRWYEHERNVEYSKETKELQACVHNGDRDRGILLDAHDLILKTPDQTLKFWTLYNELSDTCKEKIKTNLKISEVIDLKYC